MVRKQNYNDQLAGINGLKFPYYSGNIFNPQVIGHLSLYQFIEAHANPSVKTRALIKEINKASRDGDKKKKNKLKEQLYAFTPCVMLKVGSSRRYNNIIEFTGLIQLDFDGIESREDSIRLRDAIFERHPQIICTYLSPSGFGVKALLKITKCKDTDDFSAIDQFKAIHKSVTSTFEEYGYFDEVTKNAILPLFLSHDEAIRYRNYEDTETWTAEDWTVVEYVNLVERPSFPIYGENQSYYFQKVVEITTKRINDITDNGHPQVRDTALVLGSRVGAGYIDMNDAEQLIASLIYQNSYLQKGLAGYIKTSRWGIQNGMNRPKYFNSK